MNKSLWFLVVALVATTSCSTFGALAYKKPAWGVSKSVVQVSDIPAEMNAGDPSSSLSVAVVPSQNLVLLQIGKTHPIWEFPDRMGSIDTLKGAMAKYLEWKSKLVGTDADVTKEISRTVTWMFDAPSSFQYHVEYGDGKYQLADDPVEVTYSLVTGKDKSYLLRMSFTVSRPKGGDYFSSDKVYLNDPQEVIHLDLNEDQVNSLLASLDESVLKEKASTVDATEGAQAQDAQAKAEKDQTALDSLK